MGNIYRSTTMLKTFTIYPEKDSVRAAFHHGQRGTTFRLSLGKAAPNFPEYLLKQDDIPVAILRGKELVCGGEHFAVIPLLLAIQPFAEWLIHVYILHFKPRRIAGRVVDLAIARAHRAHHRDPWVLEHVFIPIRGGWIGFGMLATFWYTVEFTAVL